MLGLPAILQVGPRASWRPSCLNQKVADECLSGIVSIPFSLTTSASGKSEKASLRACDFTFWSSHQKSVYQQQHHSKATVQPAPDQVAGSEFTLVDSSKLVKNKNRFIKRPRPVGTVPGPGGAPMARSGTTPSTSMMPGGSRGSLLATTNQRRFNPFGRTTNVRVTGSGSGGGRKDKLGAAYQQSRAQIQTNRWSAMRARAVAAECAAEISPDWQHISDLTFSSLSGSEVSPKEIVIQDICWSGKLSQFNGDFDRVNINHPREIPDNFARKYPYVEPRTQDDPILATRIETDQATRVIITDQILAAIMAAPQSRFSWQFRCYRFDDNQCKLVIDKGPSFSNLDLVTINETAAELPPQDSSGKIRSVQDVGIEGAKTNLNFSYTTIQGQPVIREFDGEELDEVPPGKAFRYRQFALPPGKKRSTDPKSLRNIPLNIVVRTRVDAIQKQPDGHDSYVAIRAMNEGPVPRGSTPWSVALERQKVSPLCF